MGQKRNCDRRIASMYYIHIWTLRTVDTHLQIGVLCWTLPIHKVPRRIECIVKFKCSPRSLASKRPTWGMPMRGQWTRGGCRQCVRHRGFRQKHVWSRRHSECAEPTSRFRWLDRRCWRSRCPSRQRSRSGLQRSRGWMRQVIRGHLKIKQNNKIITTAVLK